jgi:hypothetical protein
MLQRRQIVKAVANQIDIENLPYAKYAITSFHSIARILISVNVTIYRTNTPSQNCRSSHFITIAKLRSSI